MIDGENGADLPDLLIGLFGRDEVVDGEDDGGQISYSLAADAHGTPEAGVQGRGDPCGTEIRSIVQVCQGFRRFEADKFGKVAAGVEPEKGQDNGLPGSEAL